MDPKASWNAALLAVNLDPLYGEPLLKELLNKYQARGRHYHNLGHVLSLLKASEQYRAHLQAPAEVQLAIWYHDAIYNALRKDNEQRSAQLARKHLWGLQAPKSLLQRLEQLILQTANHLAEIPASDTDMAWFLDFDMGILGTDPDTYSQYAEQIRKEYRLVPEVLYRQGRLKLLRRWLQADFLFHTPTFRKLYEKQARANLLKEIQFWQESEA